MKKITICLLALMSLSAFAAATKSEFERGYDAGVAANQTENAHVCKVLFEINENIPRAVGLSRGRAIQSLYNVCSILSGPARATACIEALEAGKAECTKI